MNAERKSRSPLHSVLGRLAAFLPRVRGKPVPAGTECAEDDTEDFQPLTPEQHAAVARAEPSRRGRVIESLLVDNGTLDVARPLGETSAVLADEPSSDAVLPDVRRPKRD